MSDTPITDSAAIALHGTRLAPGCIYVKAEDMRNLERQLASVTRERDELASKFTKLDKPKYSGLPMLDEVLANPNPEFSAWVASLPATYWTRYDLSAARIGWEAARTWNDSDRRIVRIIRCREDNCETDYIVDMERPDGSVVSVMIPNEGLDNHASRVVKKNDPEKPFGLNLVCDGHYS